MEENLRGMRVLSVTRLGGDVAGGEGMAVHAGRDGRRTLFIAAEHAPADFVALDVTDPRRPSVACRRDIPPGVRSNNLAIHGDLLAVTRQATKKGGQPAGVEFFDISDPAEPRSTGFFDASGSQSVGTHFVWLAADGYAYLATQADGYAPRDPRDRFIMSVLDVSDPSRPAEVGRWWPPGVLEGDDAPPPLRPAQRLADSRGVTLTSEQRAARRADIGPDSAWDFGIRVHNVTVLPERPDRAYVACTSGGGYILDISDRSRPSVAGTLQYSGPLPGAAHTFVPLGTSGYALLSDETLEESAADAPQNLWIVDARIEERPLIIGSAGPQWPDPVPAQGRFGAHNLHEYPPGQAALRDFGIAAGAFFGLGVGVYDVSVPYRPREIGYFAPGADGEAPGSGQLNDVYLDDRAVVYCVDRRADLCYALELQ